MVIFHATVRCNITESKWTRNTSALTSIYQYASSLILGASGIMYNECVQLYIFMVLLHHTTSMSSCWMSVYKLNFPNWYSDIHNLLWWEKPTIVHSVKVLNNLHWSDTVFLRSLMLWYHLFEFHSHIVVIPPCLYSSWCWIGTLGTCITRLECDFLVLSGWNRQCFITLLVDAVICCNHT